MQVAKWGYSLAVRLPAAAVEALELKEGDDIDILIAGSRSFEIKKKPGAGELLSRLRPHGQPGHQPTGALGADASGQGAAMSAIDTILNDILRREGVYVNHLADRGGPTNSASPRRHWGPGASWVARPGSMRCKH